MAGGFRAWVFDLDVGEAAVARLQQLLTADETARAARYANRREFGRYVAGRAALRQILGHCLGRTPSSLRFTYGPFGKPALQACDGNLPLQFNASGSGALGIVATHPSAPVGVDVEQVRELADEADIARLLLAGPELDEYGRLDASARTDRLLDTWTRKEALAKAEGGGLRHGLDRFRLYPWPGRGELQVEGTTGRLWVAPIAVPRTGFKAAVASNRRVGDVRCNWWQGQRLS